MGAEGFRCLLFGEVGWAYFVVDDFAAAFDDGYDRFFAHAGNLVDGIVELLDFHFGPFVEREDNVLGGFGTVFAAFVNPEIGAEAKTFFGGVAAAAQVAVDEEFGPGSRVFLKGFAGELFEGERLFVFEQLELVLMEEAQGFVGFEEVGLLSAGTIAPFFEFRLVSGVGDGDSFLRKLSDDSFRDFFGHDRVPRVGGGYIIV